MKLYVLFLEQSACECGLKEYQYDCYETESTFECYMTRCDPLDNAITHSYLKGFEYKPQFRDGYFFIFGRDRDYLMECYSAYVCPYGYSFIPNDAESHIDELEPQHCDGTMPDEGLVQVFTDGACLGNPGPGGWATIIRCEDSEVVLSGGEPDTTRLT